MNDTPDWLKRMEHGTQGEARARSFLVDRFWVLERSVDVDGADYLIQRRLTRSTFLDNNAPRLGVIQVKFLQDSKTTQYIHRDYICDRLGHPYGEFFLLAHTGAEDNQRLFLLSAEDITNSFRLVEPGKTNENKYAIPGKALIESTKFDVTNKKRALDRIEHALEIAELIKNRSFVASAFAQHITIDPSHIHDDYQVELENDWGNIKDSFFEIKKKAQRILWDVESLADTLRKVVASTDPVDAYVTLEAELDLNYAGEATFQLRDLLDEDLYTVASEHKRKLEALREKGLEAMYLAFQEKLTDWITTNLAQHMPLKKFDGYKLSILFDLQHLDKAQFKSEIVPNSFKDDDLPGQLTIPTTEKLIEATSEKMELLMRPGVWGFSSFDPKTRKSIHPNPTTVEEWRAILLRHPHYFRGPVMSVINSLTIPSKK